MKLFKKSQVFLLAVTFVSLTFQAASAQSFVRYIKLDDIGTKTLYADSVLTTVTLPRGLGRLENYPELNDAVYELSRVMSDPDKKLMQVWVCGCTSPDGLWADNVEVSRMRTDAVAAYLMSAAGVSQSMIHKESLNEDWDRLAELVADSDMPYKWEILHIIRTEEWGARKKALQRLDNGRVWAMLERTVFPKLRGVRIGIYCKWDPSKPYLSAPKEDFPDFYRKSEKDTVVVRDTVYVVQEYVPYEPVEEPDTVSVAEDVVDNAPMTKKQAYEIYRENSIKEKKYWYTPWMMGVKTNLLADAIAVPMAGLEIQIAQCMSLDLQGWYTGYNLFNSKDGSARMYGFSPEMRWWILDRAMTKGSFLGINASLAWYAVQWKDGLLYQNIYPGPLNVNDKSKPAWSLGLTYGYAFALDRKAHWGLELLIGVGYGNFSQKIGVWDEANEAWSVHKHERSACIGLTKAGINLTYRFSLRRVKSEYDVVE